MIVTLEFYWQSLNFYFSIWFLFSLLALTLLQFSWTVIVVFLSGFAHKLFHLMPWWQKLFHSTKITIIIITPRSIHWVFQNCLSLLNWWNGFSSMFSIQKISMFQLYTILPNYNWHNSNLENTPLFRQFRLSLIKNFQRQKNRYLFFIWRYAQKIFGEIE